MKLFLKPPRLVFCYQAELAVSDFSGDGAGILAAASTIVSTFLLVFVAEWGDKSFFSTIGESYYKDIMFIEFLITGYSDDAFYRHLPINYT